MFTIKLYTNDGWKQRIYEADDFTVLREYTREGNGPSNGCAEITAHRKSGDDIRFDVGPSPYEPCGGVWEKAIIENAAGRTTEIIGSNVPRQSPVALQKAA